MCTPNSEQEKRRTRKVLIFIQPSPTDSYHTHAFHYRITKPLAPMYTIQHNQHIINIPSYTLLPTPPATPPSCRIEENVRTYFVLLSLIRS